MMNEKWNFDGIPQKLQGDYLKNQTNLKKSAQESGWLGKIWGTKHVSNNVAGLVCLVSLIVLVVTIFSKNMDNDTKNLFIQTSSSLITLSLGYLFGSNRKMKDDTEN